MKRFFGMMPRSEIETEKKYDTGNGMYITIQAGPNGWTIIYADGGTQYKDIEATTEDNLEAAFAIAKEQFKGLLIPVDAKKQYTESDSEC